MLWAVLTGYRTDKAQGNEARIVAVVTEPLSTGQKKAETKAINRNRFGQLWTQAHAKGRPAVGTSTTHVELEVPRFGQFARQYARIRSTDVGVCLAKQRRSGERLGRLLVDCGLLLPEEVEEILRRQARWAAAMRSHDIAPQQFPLNTPFSLCLPCFNEAAVIEEVLSGALAVLPQFVEEFEVVIVDDGSTDATPKVVERLARRDDRIRLVRHAVNRGYGAAVSTALKAAHGEWICLTDGDGQFSLVDLPQLLVEAQEADVVIGYRFRRAEGHLRRLNAHGWNRLIRHLLGVRVRDLDCAFKLFPRWVLDRIQLTAEGACVSAEIMAQCVRGGLSIREVPVNHFPRAAGKATGANIKVIAKAFRELPHVWRYRRSSQLSRPSNGVDCQTAVHDGNGTNGSAVESNGVLKRTAGDVVSPGIV